MSRDVDEVIQADSEANAIGLFLCAAWLFHSLCNCARLCNHLGLIVGDRSAGGYSVRTC